MKRCLVLLLVLVMAFAGAASASVQQGDTELDFLGGFMTLNGADDGADIDTFFASGALGYFLTDNFQVQGAAFGAWTEITLDGDGDDADVDVDVWGIGAKAKWHFMPTNQWVPYIGAQILWTEADIDASDIFEELDDTADGTLWGPVAGLRYELNETNDFFVEYQYQVWEGDVGDLLDDGHLLFVGIIHQFK